MFKYLSRELIQVERNPFIYIEVDEVCHENWRWIIVDNKVSSWLLEELTKD